MSNRTTANPIYVDQFNADVTLATKGQSFIVKKIVMKSAAAGDIFELEDESGNVIFEMHQKNGAGKDTERDFGDEGFNFGNKVVKIDVSDCTGMAASDGTDAVWIYLA